MSLENKVKQFVDWKTSITLKVFIIGIIISIMMIPLSMIDSLIFDRKQYRKQAVQEVSQMWGKEQTISGPVFKISILDSNKNILKHIHFVSKDLVYDTKVKSKVLERGIFKIPVYESELKISGKILLPNISDYIAGDSSALDMKNLIMAIGISDAKTIRGDVSLVIAGKKVRVFPGAKRVENLRDGLHAELGELIPQLTTNTETPFELNMNIVGSENFSFIPLGESVSLFMESDWNSPSFSGKFLPIEREVSDSGFRASWKLPRFGRDVPLAWLGNRFQYDWYGQYAFGVDFILPVDSYTQSMRAIKYGELFLFLTFAVFFLMEILHGLKIHFIQYLGVAVALCLFYLLLLSFSEQISFLTSYALASLATILMISLYSLKLLKNKIRALMIFGLLALLYTFLYVLLQAEDLSLLFGSLGLFVALALFMYKTRNVDWYNVKAEVK